MSGLTNIYFIQGENGGPVKIGKAKDIKRRIYQHQCSYPEKIKLIIQVTECPPEVEGRIHSVFSSDRIRGEWFKPEILGDNDKIMVALQGFSPLKDVAGRPSSTWVPNGADSPEGKRQHRADKNKASAERRRVYYGMGVTHDEIWFKMKRMYGRIKTEALALESYRFATKEWADSPLDEVKVPAISGCYQLALMNNCFVLPNETYDTMMLGNYMGAVLRKGENGSISDILITTKHDDRES